MLLLVDDLLGNSVHVGGTLLGQGLAEANVGVFLVLETANETSGLELLKAVADVLASSLDGVLGAGAVSLGATVVLAEGVDTSLLAHVELVSDGGGAGVEPVVIIGGELSSAGGLGVFGPL